MLDHRVYTFLALYDEMNYRRTAERLNMTQPGVTQHIHYLENHYGVKLFEYDGRVLSRTENARLLKRHFDGIRTEELGIIRELGAADILKLKIGATKTIGEFVIVPQVRRFLADPRHELDLVIDNTEVLLTQLADAQLDFAIIEGVFDKRKYHHHLYKKEDFVGICSISHPFAGKTVSLEETFEQNIVVREIGSGTRRLLEQAITDSGYSLECFKRCTSVSNFSVICELVAKDNAVTFAYAPVAHSRPDLATFELKDTQIMGEFNYVYCSERMARQRIEAFTV